MIRFFVSLLFFLGVALWAAPTFPELTGRVVDQAGLLTPDQERSLSELSKSIEDNSTAQVVVVTLKSLEGYDIADYGYQLGRYWKIGQKGKDNGLLIIIAPHDHKVRIEVGYGLEGLITDAEAHELIQSQLIPHIKQQDVYGGIKNTMDEIKSIISHENTGRHSLDKTDHSNRFYWIVIALIPFLFMGVRSKYHDGKKQIHSVKKLLHSLIMGGFSGALALYISHILLISGIIGFIVFLISYFSDKNSDFGSIIDSMDNHTGSRSSDSFDIFSGGGGSFGGGGASGSW
ncbi:TPM domain-containing protein [Sulfuricurvum sp.]|uniref:TPM domain-containing protein n=1 Tax=Sulfuricurvum sp. TaxID=2025608 RepID=UPI002D431EAD|nr:TPM domain-containing protein [Sulfuricurvum sp.]HZF70969.1 TPM domain-containing protein [Sulfuricurvum sp.]